MPKRSDTNPQLDLNQLAAAIADAATNEDASETIDDGKDPAAAALTPERRKEIAQKAVAARWGDKRANERGE